LAFAPDGKVLAAQGWLWEVATGKPLRPIGDYEGDGCGISFSPDGTMLAVGTYAGQSVDLWDVATGKQRHAFPAHRHGVSVVAYAADGQTLASAASDGMIYLWNPRTGKPRRCFGRRGDCYSAPAFSADGRLLASAGSRIVLWDAVTGKELREVQGPIQLCTRVGTAVAFAPDGKTLISAGTDDVQLWEVATGKRLRQIRQGQTTIQELALSPDGQLLATTGGEARTVWLWDVPTGKPLRSLAAPGTRSLAFSPDGRTVALVTSGVGNDNAVVCLWNVVEGRLLREIPAPVAREFFPVRSLSFSADAAVRNGFFLALTGAASERANRPFPLGCPARCPRVGVAAGLGWLFPLRNYPKTPFDPTETREKQGVRAVLG
jgi:WD40 repeat protein